MKKDYPRKQWLEIKNLHKLIIHKHETIKNDQEWYRLARKETVWVEKLDQVGQLEGICGRCF